jgi:predicted dehydrogenase
MPDNNLSADAFSMTPPLKLGILGLGEGISILSAAKESKLAEPYLVCDLNEELCKERCKAFALERYTTNYEDLLSDSEVDCVAIYTPDPFHGEHIIAALEAGKHVICTKPLIKGLKDAARLWEAAQKHNTHILVGQSCRFFETFRLQSEEKDKLGELLSVEAHYNGDKRGGTSGKWGKAGAVDWLYTGMAHPADLAFWHLGEIECVNGVAVMSPAAKKMGQLTPDNFHFTLKAKSGAIGRISGCFGTAMSHPDGEAMIGCTLRGSTGTSQADYPNFHYYQNFDDEGCSCINRQNRHAYFFRWGGSKHHAGEFQNYLEYFARCIQSGERARPDLRDGIQLIALLEAMGRSIQTNETVRPDDLLQEFGVDGVHAV